MRIREWMRRERLYVLLFLFVAIVTAASWEGGGRADDEERVADVLLRQEFGADEFTQEMAEHLFAERPQIMALLGVCALLGACVFLLGLFVDGALIAHSLRRRGFSVSGLSPVRWGVGDVLRVVVLFLFLDYALMIFESGMSCCFPAFENRHLLMALNTTVMDIIVLVLTVYLVRRVYGMPLSRLGIGREGLFRHIGYGILGYIAFVPPFVVAFALVLMFSQLVRYTPPVQPILRFFMQEQNRHLVWYMTFFASFVAPVIEEIFFRGFMYQALRTRFGSLIAGGLTAFVFAALHANVLGFVPIFMLGALFVILFEVTGSLVPAMTVHIVHNSAMLLLMSCSKLLKG